MTLASSIIKRAYRATNLIPIAGAVSSAEQTEGLELLNSLLLGVMGNEVGSELTDLPLGGQFDQTSAISDGIPANVRLVVETSPGTANLNPYPYDGQRVAVVGDFASSNLVLDGNGRKVAGAATLTLSADSTSRQFFYRADTANWQEVAELAAGDTFPLPVEFDDYFVTRLAMRLNPQHGASMTQEQKMAMDEAETKLRARYRKPRPPQDNGALGLMGQQSEGSEASLYGRA